MHWKSRGVDSIAFSPAGIFKDGAFVFLTTILSPLCWTYIQAFQSGESQYPRYSPPGLVGLVVTNEDRDDEKGSAREHAEDEDSDRNGYENTIVYEDESFYKNEGIWEEKKAKKKLQLILILFHLKLNSKHLTTFMHSFRQENSNNDNFRFILMAAHVKMPSLLPQQ